MPSCTVAIGFDRPDRTYAMGEAVRGVVELRVDQDCECKRLVLSYDWAEGDYGRPPSSAEGIELFRGQLRTGQVLRYPFEFIAPPGPASYNGRHLQVNWHAGARADLPWAIDATATEQFFIVGRLPHVTDPFLGPNFVPPNPGKARVKVHAAIAMGFLLLTVGVIALFIAAQSRWGTPLVPEFDVTCILGGAVFFLLPAAIILGWAVRPLLAERRLGPMVFRILTPVVVPGQPIAVDLRFRPTAPLDIEGIHVHLLGKEHVVRGSGKHSRTYEHTVMDTDLVLCGPRSVAAGAEVVLTGQIPLPWEAPSTFVWHNARLGWSATPSIAIKGWPDWALEWDFAVLPPVVPPRSPGPAPPAGMMPPQPIPPPMPPP